MPLDSRFILDTNVVIALIDGDVTVRERIAAAAEVIIPSPALGELFFGAYRSNRPDVHLAVIDGIARSYAILPIDADTAAIFGKLQQDLLVKGRPIPVNVVWINAIAQQWNARVATRDVHFEEMSGVMVERW